MSFTLLFEGELTITLLRDDGGREGGLVAEEVEIELFWNEGGG
jgi:hypothetical protein